MRKKRILYNEISEDIYENQVLSKTSIIAIGITVLILAFLLNFGLESKINSILSSMLQNNTSCPAQFEKAELKFFPPGIIIKKINLSGICFGQTGNSLLVDDLKINLDFPSILNLGLRLNILANAEGSNIALSPILSPFSYLIEIEKSSINAKIFRIFSSENKSIIAGKIFVQGFLKFEDNKITDGKIKMESNSFYFPAQRISGFDLPNIELNLLDLMAEFTSPKEMKIRKLRLGKPGKQIEINLAGKLNIPEKSFNSSILLLDGELKLSPQFMNNFSFITLMLPEGAVDGKYHMRINGPLTSPGAPVFSLINGK